MWYEPTFAVSCPFRKVHAVLPVFSTLVLVLVTQAPVTASTAPLPCLSDSPHVELSREPGDEVPGFCIRPGSGIVIVFDAPLLVGGVTVQERGRFKDLSQGERSVTLLPPLDGQAGERFRLEVRFADGAAPERATFELVVHPTRAARQAEVSRPPRISQDDPRETKEREARLRQCETALEKLEQTGPGPGIAGLLSAGVMDPNDAGVRARHITRTVLLPPSNPLLAKSVFSYRTTPPAVDGQPPTAWVTVTLELSNPDTVPWTPGSAALVTPGEEPRTLKLWPPTPVTPGETSHWVTVETQLPAEQARLPSRIDLWDESGLRPLSVGGVIFP